VGPFKRIWSLLDSLSRSLYTRLSEHCEGNTELDIEITINAESRQIPSGMTVAQLLVLLGKQPRYLAVERNQVLVARTQHADCVLLAGDQIEIVTLVGGG
jgi:sulfur carrier protein